MFVGAKGYFFFWDLLNKAFEDSWEPGEVVKACQNENVGAWDFKKQN